MTQLSEPMPAGVRLATPADVEALTDLLLAVGPFRWMEERPREAVAAQVGSHLDLCLGGGGHGAGAHTVYVAEEPRLLAGFLAVHWLPYLIRPGMEGFVSELFVHPEARGRGIGSHLLEAVTVDARRRGCERLSLLNGRDRESYERNFYANRGWVERPDFANFVLLM